MTSTLLFVDGHPVSYIIEPEGDHFVLYPRYDYHPDVEPPRLTACRKDGQWRVEGTSCQNLADQVAEDLENLTAAQSALVSGE